MEFDISIFKEWWKTLPDQTGSSAASTHRGVESAVETRDTERGSGALSSEDHILLRVPGEVCLPRSIPSANGTPTE
jgi:hypothetical protein